MMLGVAIAIPQPHAGVLTTWRRHVGDAAANMVYPHVTLLPPTPVDPAALPAVERHLSQVAAGCEPFMMHLAGTGTFRPTSPVVFVQVARGVSDCELLERAIRDGPLRRDLEFPFHPHVTIAQDVPDDQLDEACDGLSAFAARFRVERFALFCRDGAGQWGWRSEFELGTAQDAPDGAADAAAGSRN